MAPAIWHQPLKEPSPWSWLNEGVGGYGRAGTPSASPGLHQGAPLALLWQSGEALGEANGPEPASITGLHRAPCVCIWRPCSASAHSFSKIIHLHAVHCTQPAFKTQKMRSLPPVLPPPLPRPTLTPGASTALVLQRLDLPSMRQPGLYPTASPPMEWVADEMSSPSGHRGWCQVGTEAT